MDEKQLRRVIMMSLASLLVGSLLFIFGVSIKGTLWPLIINYIIGMFLYISSFLAVYNNNKKHKQGIFKYIMALSVFLMLLVTATMVSNLL